MDYLLYFILKVNYSLVVATFSDSNSFETIFIEVVPTFYFVDSKDNVLLDWCPLLGWVFSSYPHQNDDHLEASYQCCSVQQLESINQTPIFGETGWLTWFFIPLDVTCQVLRPEAIDFSKIAIPTIATIYLSALGFCVISCL